MTGRLPFGGLSVIVGPALPIAPSPGEDARRIVRHGLADVLAWLGEDVGPKPGELTQAYRMGNTFVVSRAFFEQLVVPGVARVAANVLGGGVA